MQIFVIADFQNAIEKAKDILYEKVDKKTVLFLSGGATPKSLYSSLAKEGSIHPAAIGMIDERFGKKMHEKSNEYMIDEAGLLLYAKKQQIPFYPILTKNTSREKAAEEYDKIMRDLFFHFPKSIAVMGIGEDGHIAGIPPEFSNSQFQITKKSVQTFNENDFVTSYYDRKMKPPERITMTFAGLALIDYFIVLVFGKEKKKALQDMFEPGSLEEVPVRFFAQQASNNSIIITDQQI